MTSSSASLERWAGTCMVVGQGKKKVVVVGAVEGDVGVGDGFVGLCGGSRLTCPERRRRRRSGC